MRFLSVFSIYSPGPDEFSLAESIALTILYALLVFY